MRGRLPLDPLGYRDEAIGKHIVHAIVCIEGDMRGAYHLRLFDQVVIRCKVFLVLHNVKQGVGDLARLQGS